jgi:hypothetical protein
VGTYAYGEKGSKGAAPVVSRLVFANLRIVGDLEQALRQAESKDVTLYMYDWIFFIFLNDAAEVSDAYVYYPVTKPDGGFLKAEAWRISPTIFMVKPDGFDRGLYSPQALKIIKEIVPEELIWTLKE